MKVVIRYGTYFEVLEHENGYTISYESCDRISYIVQESLPLVPSKGTQHHVCSSSAAVENSRTYIGQTVPGPPNGFFLEVAPKRPVGFQENASENEGKTLRTRSQEEEIIYYHSIQHNTTKGITIKGFTSLPLAEFRMDPRIFARSTKAAFDIVLHTAYY